jgi:glycosyltransferase involved in cell wall biosynthesis
VKVALLTPAYWPEVGRGAERVVRDLAGELVGRGHRARVLTSHPGAPSRADEGGVEVVRSWRPPDGPLLARGFQEHMTHVPFSARALRRGDDDLAHAHYPTDAVAAGRWAAATGRPAVFTYHGIPQREVLASRRLRMRVLEEALAAPDAIVVSSRAAADAMQRWLGVRAEPIHPGVDLAVFSPGGERAQEPTIFCAAAVSDARKRIGLLVRAFARLRRELPAARLVLLRPREPALAAQYGRVEGVVLMDPVADPAALAAVYRRAWVSALSAYNEAFGLVLAEALACGTPVVGTRDGGIPEVLGDAPVGALFERDDEDGLVRALREALDLAREDGVAAACRARAETFSVTRFGDAHVALYDRLLQQRGQV